MRGGSEEFSNVAYMRLSNILLILRLGNKSSKHIFRLPNIGDNAKLTRFCPGKVN